jgi:hypothetical protein
MCDIFIPAFKWTGNKNKGPLPPHVWRGRCEIWAGLPTVLDIGVLCCAGEWFRYRVFTITILQLVV